MNVYCTRVLRPQMENVLVKTICLNTLSSRQCCVQANGTRACEDQFAWTRVPLVKVAFKQIDHVLVRSICLNRRSSRQRSVQANGTRACEDQFAWTRVPLVSVALKQMEHVLVKINLLEHAFLSSMSSSRKWNTCLWRSIFLHTRSSRQCRVQANGTRACDVPFAWTPQCREERDEFRKKVM
jgi:hypothetical protein